VAGCSLNTLPIALPKETEPPFTVFLGSCFCVDKDASGEVGKHYLALNPEPNIKFLCGDQVYLDHPITDRVFSNKGHLQDDIFRKYLNTWTQSAGFNDLLKNGANFFTSDDHEYWNNAPKGSLLIPSTLLPSGKKQRLEVTKELYKVFQTEYNTVSFSVGKLSFFVADTRINRDSQFIDFMLDSDLDKLKNWVETLANPGVLVLGQPLFQEEVTVDYIKRLLKNLEDKIQESNLSHNDDVLAVLSNLKATINGGLAVPFLSSFILSKLDKLIIREIDATLRHFDQYKDLIKIISNSKHSIVILSGDIHYSRISKCILTTGVEIIEVVSSPMALVSDKARGLELPVRNSFAKNISGAIEGTVSTITNHLNTNNFKPSENHFTTLEFLETDNNQIEMKVKIWPIDRVNFIEVGQVFTLT
jgi:hypothetical protein